MSEDRRAPKWTYSELEALINGYITRKSIIEGKLSSTLTNQTKEKAYQELMDEVNAVGMGGRTLKMVKKQVSDQKSKVRAKRVAMNRERQKTGGGSIEAIPLTELEERLLSTMNPQIINGIIEDGESGCGQQSRDTNLRGQSPEKVETMDSEKSKPSATLSVSSKQTPDTPLIITIDSTDLTNLRGQGPFLKKRKFSSNMHDNRVTSDHAEKVLEVENKKLCIAEQMIRLKKIKLMLMLKDMEARNIDVTEEIKQLEELNE